MVSIHDAIATIYAVRLHDLDHPQSFRTQLAVADPALAEVNGDRRRVVCEDGFEEVHELARMLPRKSKQ